MSTVRDRSSDSYITSWIFCRLCYDYGLVPHLLSKPEASQLILRLNGKKNIGSRKGVGPSPRFPGASHKSKYTAASEAISHGPEGGLAFSEFVEFLTQLSLRGMLKDTYNSVFPTPYAKVISMLMTWGLVDMKKLHSVKAMTAKGKQT